MTLDTRDTLDRMPSVGVEAVDLEPVRDLRINNEELMMFDEQRREAWIQSDVWIGSNDMI